MKHALIMAGGAGTRLWPMSTRSRPKQLIPIVGGKSLLELASDRLEGFIDPARQLLCTGEQYRAAIRKAIPRFTDEQIIGEPEGRDTLAAVGLPAALMLRRDPEAIMVVLTADHVITPTDLFRNRLRTGVKLVREHPEAMVTFGVEPTHPATGYGYVQLGDPVKGFNHSHHTRSFREKPDLETARKYVDDADGSYLWNSGMFVWRADTLLSAIEAYEPEVHAALTRIADAWDTPDRLRVLGELYPKIRKISVDFAVMEKAAKDKRFKLMTVALPVRWLDVGSWPSFAQTLEQDAEGNRSAGARTAPLDATNVLLVSDDPEHLIAAVGVSDLVVVRTAKATLICHASAAEDLKRLHQMLAKEYGERYL